MSRYSTRHDDGRPDTSRTITGLDIAGKLAVGGGYFAGSPSITTIVSQPSNATNTGWMVYFVNPTGVAEEVSVIAQCVDANA
ncbi:hypothetical protein [Streptomyces sp. NPDC016734]